jgi:hypothetical protein
LEIALCSKYIDNELLKKLILNQKNKKKKFEKKRTIKKIFHALLIYK